MSIPEIKLGVGSTHLNHLDAKWGKGGSLQKITVKVARRGRKGAGRA